MYIRQICLVAHQLEPVLQELSSVLGIERCYVDSGVAKFGLENTLMAIGSNFLEVVAPVEENTAAGRFLERRKGDGGYMFICQVDRAEEQKECRRRADQRGVRVAYEGDHGDYHLMQLHPGDLKNAMWEIDWDENAQVRGIWEPAGGLVWQQHVRNDVTLELTGAELQCDDPLATASLWSEIAGLERKAIKNGHRLDFENGELRFVSNRDDRGPGLVGVDLTVRDKKAVLAAAEAIGKRGTEDEFVELCGTRFYLNEN